MTNSKGATSSELNPTSPKKATRTRAKTTKSSASKASTADKPVSSASTASADISNPAPKKEYSLTDVVEVRNGYQGDLIYTSKKTGEVYQWDGFGDTQDMEMSELRNARSSAKGFYINNWWLFDDPGILDYLGVARFYKDSLGVDGFDDIFLMELDEMVAVIKKLPEGQKASVAFRASELVREGAIDSRNKIKALEKCLGIHLLDY